MLYVHTYLVMSTPFSFAPPSRTIHGGKWGVAPQRKYLMSSWYLLYCSAQAVERVISHVQTLGITVSSPTYFRIQRRKDCNAVRVEEKRLFPNYLFLSFDIEHIHTSAVTEFPGAIGFVRFGSDPCVVPQDVVTAINCARLLAKDNETEAIECRNIPSELIEKIQEISLIRSNEKRQIAFANLLQTTL